MGITLAALQGHEEIFRRFFEKWCDAARFLQIRLAKHLKQASVGMGRRVASINGAAGGDRPELFDAVGTDADIPVVEVDGRVAVAGDEADLVAEPEAVGGGRGGCARRRRARGSRRAGIESQRLEAGVSPRPGGSSLSPTRQAQLEGLGRRAVAVETAGENRAAMLFGHAPTRRMRPGSTAVRAERIDGTSGLRSCMRLDRARTSKMPKGNVERRCWNPMLRSIVTRTSYWPAIRRSNSPFLIQSSRGRRRCQPHDHEVP